MRADVSQTRRAQQRVAECVGHDVAVGMSHGALVERDFDAADDELAPLGEAMQVVADAAANAHAFFLPELEIEAGQFHVRGLGDFDIALGAVNHVHVVAEALDEAGFIGGVYTVGFPRGQRLLSGAGFQKLEAFARARCVRAEPCW